MIDSTIFNTTIQIKRKAESINDFGDYTESFGISVASGIASYITSIKVDKVPLEQGQEFVGSHKAYANVVSFTGLQPQNGDKLYDLGDSRKAYDIVSLEKLRTIDELSGHHYKFILKYV